MNQVPCQVSVPIFPSSSVPVVLSSSRLFEVSLVACSSLAPLSPRFLPHSTRPHVQTHPLHSRQRLLGTLPLVFPTLCSCLVAVLCVACGCRCWSPLSVRDHRARAFRYFSVVVSGVSMLHCLSEMRRSASEGIPQAGKARLLGAFLANLKIADDGVEMESHGGHKS